MWKLIETLNRYETGMNKVFQAWVTMTLMYISVPLQKAWRTWLKLKIY